MGKKKWSVEQIVAILPGSEVLKGIERKSC